jgi:hypothetical protein
VLAFCYASISTLLSSPASNGGAYFSVCVLCVVERFLCLLYTLHVFCLVASWRSTEVLACAPLWSDATASHGTGRYRCNYQEAAATKMGDKVGAESFVFHFLVL